MIKLKEISLAKAIIELGKNESDKIYFENDDSFTQVREIRVDNGGTITICHGYDYTDEFSYQDLNGELVLYEMEVEQ